MTTRGVLRNISKNVSNVLLGKTRRQRGGPDAAGDAARARQRLVEARRVALDVVAIERAAVGQMHQQPGEQRGVGAGLQAQEQIGIAPGIGPARVDHDHARAPRCCLLAIMRWYSTGWHQAALEPTSTSRSASSRSS